MLSFQRPLSRFVQVPIPEQGRRCNSLKAIHAPATPPGMQPRRKRPITSGATAIVGGSKRGRVEPATYPTPAAAADDAPVVGGSQVLTLYSHKIESRACGIGHVFGARRCMRASHATHSVL